MPPNIVLVHTHDMGRHIEPYGYPVETPNLQAFAEDSLLFRNAYCASPQCSPSRVGLMTGAMPHSSGLHGLAGDFHMEDYDRHLMRFLGDHGYETALSGIQHEAMGRDADIDSRERSDFFACQMAGTRELGYDRILGTEHPGELEEDETLDVYDRVNAEAAADYLREAHDDPFFLSFGMQNPHKAFPAEHDIDPDYTKPLSTLPDVPEVREETAAFHAAVQIADNGAGIVFDALRETGLLEETIVIFTTDHGPAFKDMKCDLFDDGIGVALAVRFPGGRRSGAVEDALVSQIDLFPTLCDYLDLEIPGWVEGTSLLPLVNEEARTVRDEIFAEISHHGSYEPKRCVRTDRYKYIRRYESAREHGQNIDGGPSVRFLRNHGLNGRPRPAEALYDCYHDPRERDNRVDDPEYATVREDLASRLDDWMARTDDPLREGPIPEPDG